MNDETCADLLEDFLHGLPGDIEFKKSHTGEITAGIKTVIKLRELPPEVREACLLLFRHFDCFGLHLMTRNGKPDRIEVYRIIHGTNQGETA